MKPLFINKAWDWKQVTNERWYQPSEDSYFYLHRWKELGYKEFLDLGCGRGRHALLFAQYDFNVCAVDLSRYAIEELINVAKVRKIQLNCQVADMTVLPYTDNKFDCLIAYHVISHSNTLGVIKAISEIHRTVRSGGEVFITFGSIDTLNMMTKGFHHIEPNVIIKSHGPEEGVPHYYTDEDNLRDLLVNFDILSIRKIQNIDIIDNNKFGYHFFIHARTRK